MPPVDKSTIQFVTGAKKMLGNGDPKLAIPGEPQWISRTTGDQLSTLPC